MRGHAARCVDRPGIMAVELGAQLGQAVGGGIGGGINAIFGKWHVAQQRRPIKLDQFKRIIETVALECGRRGEVLGVGAEEGQGERSRRRVQLGIKRSRFVLLRVAAQNDVGVFEIHGADGRAVACAQGTAERLERIRIDDAVTLLLEAFWNRSLIYRHIFLRRHSGFAMPGRPAPALRRSRNAAQRRRCRECHSCRLPVADTAAGRRVASTDSTRRDSPGRKLAHSGG